MKILIDAGHSLNGDVGARGCGLKEELETRKIAKELAIMLHREGHDAIFVHCDSASSVNESLNYRTNKANKEGGDLYVSIHLNAFNSKAFGTETYVYKKGTTADVYATRINNNLSKTFFNRGVKTANFHVLKRTSMPAILVEACFIDSRDDINDYNAKEVALAIASGICNKALSPVEEGSGVGPVSGTTWRVICGSFQSKENALERLKMVERETSLECFLDPYKI